MTVIAFFCAFFIIYFALLFSNAAIIRYYNHKSIDIDIDTTLILSIIPIINIATFLILTCNIIIYILKNHIYGN